jgi:hypothetical protein
VMATAARRSILTPESSCVSDPTVYRPVRKPWTLNRYPAVGNQNLFHQEVVCTTTTRRRSGRNACDDAVIGAD